MKFYTVKNSTSSYTCKSELVATDPRSRATVEEGTNTGTLWLRVRRGSLGLGDWLLRVLLAPVRFSAYYCVHQGAARGSMR
eukprot:COSAG02_NODE_122_length_35306_cov_98.280967_3_plen_81_part_00